PFRVVANQDFGEGGIKGLYVASEVLAELEIELVLAALLYRHGEGETLFLGRPGDIGSELLVDEQPGPLPGSAFLDSPAEALEDDLFGLPDPGCLFWGRCALDAEEALLKGRPMIDGQHVQVPVVAKAHRSLTPLPQCSSGSLQLAGAGHHLTDRLADLRGGLPPNLQRGPPAHDVVHRHRPLLIDGMNHLAPDVGAVGMDSLQ